jgi:hypothetical protein
LISDEKLNRWCEIIGANDSAFEFNLGVEQGTQWQQKPPYPDLKVVDSSLVHVRRIVVQRVVLTASVPEDYDQAEIVVQRLVAELENGQELEMMREACPAKESEKVVDPGVCEACGQNIADELDTVWIGDMPYHSRCTK